VQSGVLLIESRAPKEGVVASVECSCLRRLRSCRGIAPKSSQYSPLFCKARWTIAI